MAAKSGVDTSATAGVLWFCAENVWASTWGWGDSGSYAEANEELQPRASTVMHARTTRNTERNNSNDLAVLDISPWDALSRDYVTCPDDLFIGSAKQPFAIGHVNRNSSGVQRAFVASPGHRRPVMVMAFLLRASGTL